MSIVKLDPNVPLKVERAKYLDLVVSKYGPQYRLKGAVEGDPDAMVYLPGKHWNATSALVAAGVINAADVPDDVDDAVARAEKGVNVPLKLTAFTLKNRKLATDEYATLEVLTNGQQPAHAAPSASAPNARQPHNAGGPLPFEDELPPSARQAPSPPVLADAAKREVDDALRLSRMMASYEDTLVYVLATVVPKMQEADLAPTPEAVLASVHTIWIARTRAGV